MVFRGDQLSQDVADPRHRQAGKWIAGLAEKAQAPVFGDGAGGPAVVAIMLEPEMRVRVKLVGGIDQGDQDVDVQQGRLAESAARSPLAAGSSRGPRRRIAGGTTSSTSSSSDA